MAQSAQALFERRRRRVRYKIRNVQGDRNRLAVHRTNQHIYAHIINAQGKVVASASSVDKDIRKSLGNGSNVKAAEAVGKLIADRAKKAKIADVVFDRGGYIYHGRVKALADAARAGGLAF